MPTPRRTSSSWARRSAHLILLPFVVIGLWIRAGKGRYEGGTWYRIRLIRFFAVWIAISTAVLATVGALFY